MVLKSKLSVYIFLVLETVLKIDKRKTLGDFKDLVSKQISVDPDQFRVSFDDLTAFLKIPRLASLQANLIHFGA